MSNLLSISSETELFSVLEKCSKDIFLDDNSSQIQFKVLSFGLY